MKIDENEWAVKSLKKKMGEALKECYERPLSITV